MPRPHSEIAADLDKVRSTLRGLRAGFSLQKPIVEAKLGAPLAAVIFRTVGNVLDVHDTLAITLEELHTRILQLELNQAKIVEGIGETARTLA